MLFVKRFLFVLFCGLFLFSLPLYLSLIEGKFKEASSTCIFSIILLIALNHKRIRVFKLWGLEAELQEAIDEANATISQLKEIATSVSKTAITTMMSDSFLGGMTLRRRHALHGEIIESLKKIKFSNKEIEEITSDWNKGICLVYATVIRNKLFKGFVDNNNSLPKNERDKLSASFQSLGNFQEWRAATPEDIQEFIRQQGWSRDIAVTDLIADYKYFITASEIKDKDRLFNEWK